MTTLRADLYALCLIQFDKIAVGGMILIMAFVRRALYRTTIGRGCGEWWRDLVMHAWNLAYIIDKN
jgi:hypothetical protein